MSLIARLDAWSGLRLFHPPIIRFCQWTGYTQHRLHRDMWFAFALAATWRSSVRGDSWAWICLQLFGCLVLGLSAALTPAGVPSESRRWIRITFLLFAVLGVLPAVVLGSWYTLASSTWVLAAEYAATIADIPPREPKRSKAVRARAAA